MSDRADLLIELGCEELPAASIQPMAQALADKLHAQLSDAGFSLGDTKVYATPRRLAVLISDVEGQQADRAIEKRGPAVQAAFDADGNPSKAAMGFAKSCGIEFDQVGRLKTDKGEWLAYNFTQKGEALCTQLGPLLEKTITNLPMPKRMRWGAGSDTFLRPVLWLVALHGSEVMPAKVLGLNSDRNTRGHRFHAPEEIALQNASDYAEVLRSQGHVEPDYTVRMDDIRNQVLAAAKAAGGQVLVDEDLVDECAALVEWPVAIAGNFDKIFLEVPKEALIQTMKNDQRYFPLLDQDGKLLPTFITISNIVSTDEDKVREGNERVIRPRLADAMFFWQQDLKQSLASHLPSLKTVVFQEKLGTLHDKTERLVRLTRHIADQLDADAVLVERAARLAKCDLMTNMVYEFPEMQGIAGKYYIYKEGESIAVASALEEQYLPKQAGDPTPEGIIGQILAIAEKLDTLAGIFGIGQKPTGTKDPFALRRASLGILRIIIERKLDLDLADLLSTAQQALADKLEKPEQVFDALDYALERLQGYYADQGIDRRVVGAVMAKRPTRPLDFDKRVHAVTAFLQLPEAEALAAANKRIQNILKKADAVGETVDESLLEAGAEATLFAALQETEAKVQPLYKAGNYSEGLKALAALRAPVDSYFDDVMVNVDDQQLKLNRLALLQRLGSLCVEAADLSQLS